MTAKDIYIKETGNKIPSNQIAYSEWRIEYVKWLEEKVENYHSDWIEDNISYSGFKIGDVIETKSGHKIKII